MLFAEGERPHPFGQIGIGEQKTPRRSAHCRCAQIPTLAASHSEKLIEIFGPQPGVDGLDGLCVEPCRGSDATISSAENKSMTAALQVKGHAHVHPWTQLCITEGKNIAPLIDGQAVARDADEDLLARTPPHVSGSRQSENRKRHEPRDGDRVALAPTGDERRDHYQDQRKHRRLHQVPALSGGKRGHLGGHGRGGRHELARRSRSVVEGHPKIIGHRAPLPIPMSRPLLISCGTRPDAAKRDRSRDFLEGADDPASDPAA